MVIAATARALYEQAAWRRRSDMKSTDEPDWHVTLQKPKDAKPGDPVEAVFEDGAKWKVPSMTCKELDANEKLSRGGADALMTVKMKEERCSLWFNDWRIEL